MVERVTAQVMSVADALRAGYDELALPRAELRHCRVAAPSNGEPDDRSYRLRSIYFALASIVAPDVQKLPPDISRRDVCRSSWWVKEPGNSEAGRSGHAASRSGSAEAGWVQSGR